MPYPKELTEVVRAVYCSLPGAPGEPVAPSAILIRLRAHPAFDKKTLPAFNTIKNWIARPDWQEAREAAQKNAAYRSEAQLTEEAALADDPAPEPRAEPEPEWESLSELSSAVAERTQAIQAELEQELQRLRGEVPDTPGQMAFTALLQMQLISQRLLRAALPPLLARLETEALETKNLISAVKMAAQMQQQGMTLAIKLEDILQENRRVEESGLAGLFKKLGLNLAALVEISEAMQEGKVISAERAKHMLLESAENPALAVLDQQLLQEAAHRQQEAEATV